MAKKKPSGSSGEQRSTKQMNVRMPLDLAERLEKAAEMLATDPSHLLRMIVVEKLPEYEERGRQARGITLQNGTDDPAEKA